MDQELEKSCWGVTFWVVALFVIALSVAYLATQGEVNKSASIQVESTVQ